MPTFRVVMIVRNHPAAQLWPSSGPTREVTTNFAGCVDAEDAKAKAREAYSVYVFKSVKELTTDG